MNAQLHLVARLRHLWLFFPANFKSAATRDELLQLSEAATVRALFRNNSIPLDELLPRAEQPPYIQNNSFEWLAPTLFIASGLLTENPVAVNLALHVIYVLHRRISRYRSWHERLSAHSNSICLLH